MTPQQQARDRAVSLLRQIVRVRTPMMSEETRDQVAREIEAIVDDLVVAVTERRSER